MTNQRDTKSLDQSVSMVNQHNQKHDDNDHGHEHVHHEGEETCTDPTHNHHHAQTPYVRAEPKVGRNEPCHCGSGKKFKKCHGA